MLHDTILFKINLQRLPTNLGILITVRFTNSLAKNC